MKEQKISLNGNYIREHINQVMSWEQKCVSFTEFLLQEIANEADASNNKDSSFKTKLDVETSVVLPIMKNQQASPCFRLRVNGKFEIAAHI